MEVAKRGYSVAKNTCSTLGCYGFTAAVGIGFVAWSATHIYVCFCAPQGVWGFIQSLVVMDSTFCQILMSLIQHTQSLYGAMMIAFLFSIVGAIGKGVAWITGEPEVPVPAALEGRVLRSRKAAV